MPKDVTLEGISKVINESLKKFDKNLAPSQNAMLKEILAQTKRLDLSGDTIKVTVKNINIINSILKKLNGLIMTDKYLKGVKDFIATFQEVTVLQNQYWNSVEDTFKPNTLMKEVKKQSIKMTVESLTEAGIGANIKTQIAAILRANITTGGSYASLTKQLNESLTDTQKSDGILTKYAKQITNDAIQQYNRQYTQLASAGLGFQWFAYRNSDIKTTRPFCDAMTDRRYFHITEVPMLLKGKTIDGPLMYKNKKTGEFEAVPIYDKTGLPQGMIEGTNAENFFIYAGGYNCRHSINPVPDENVPAVLRNQFPKSPL